MRKILFSFVIAIFTFTATHTANPQVNLKANFWKLISERNWINARTLAKFIDKQNNQGDIFLAYTDAAAALHNQDCKQATELANIVVRFAPGFLPAYDIVAACLIRDGRQRDAEKLITNISNQLNEGPDKEYYLRWAKQLQEVYEPTVDFSMSVTPSSNTNNATSADTFAGGRLSEDSRQKKGVSIFARANIVQPLMQKHDSAFGVTLAPGLSYDTVSRTNFPSLTGSIYKTRSLSRTQLVSSSIIFSKTLEQNDDFLFRRGLSLSYTNQLRPDLTWTSNMFLFNNNFNFENRERDSSSVDVSTSLNKVIDQDDKISLIIGASKNDASRHNSRSTRFDEIEQNITFEWEHRFESGFITSIGAGGGKRRLGAGSCPVFNFFGASPCTTDRRTDYFHSLTIGFSHQDITIGDVRPQLTYQMTNQKSNNVFSDFESHGVTVVFRKRF